ncbi:DUF3568 family protein [Lentisphaera profundi]|uniref:DUF3568 family protein n=1 Tax=Lentisphaera profundi TaxID=1658616 RepID=A0ABY7VST9_9BACT|nr:DUF3568 family protein [Lentisphaera profundi]WDE96280.1 DUF3568 family protein [Lentisphaera profundi]
MKFRKLYLYISLISLLVISSSCILISVGAAGGGSYAWYNGRIEKKLYHDKEHAYEIAKVFLEGQGAEKLVFEDDKYRLEAKLIVEDEKTKKNTYSISFIFIDYTPYKVEEGTNVSESQRKRMTREKGLKTKLSFQFSDGITPNQEKAREYLSAYLNLLN